MRVSLKIEGEGRLANSLPALASKVRILCWLKRGIHTVLGYQLENVGKLAFPTFQAGVRSNSTHSAAC